MRRWVPPPYGRVCELLRCQNPPALANGYYGIGNVRYQMKLTYYCQSGYRYVLLPWLFGGFCII